MSNKPNIFNEGKKITSKDVITVKRDTLYDKHENKTATSKSANDRSK